jgi:hypothetical protein
MPLAIYLLFLAYLNQRSQPTMISGPWDFAAVLLGLSGFILLGGPLLLSVIDARWRATVFGGGSFAELRAVWDANHRVWGRLAAAYVVVMIAGIVFAMRSRRKVTAIYNLDAAGVEESFLAAVESLSLGCRRIMGGYEIGRRKIRPTDPNGKVEAIFHETVIFEGGTSFVRIESYPWTNHSCLIWPHYDEDLRREVEGKLESALQTIESPDNSAGGWFLTAAVALFFSMLLWMGFLIYQLFFARNG